MKKRYLAASLSLVMGSWMVAPAMADDEPLDKAVNGSLIVTRLGGVGAGLVVGPPIATLRETVKTYKDFTQAAADKVGGKIGGKDSGPACLVVSLATAPAAVVVGGAKGVYYGSKNAFMVGFDKPFHPDSFSLGKLEEE